MDTIHQIEKTPNQIINEIFTNAIKMISARGYIQDPYEVIDSVLANLDSSYECVVPNINKKGNALDFVIKYITYDVSTLKKSQELADFLTRNDKKFNILVIIKDYTKKAVESIRREYENVEVFRASELMINLIDHFLIPKVQILTKEEQDEVYLSWGLTPGMVQNIYLSDPLVKYYNLQEYELFKVIRNSETAGLSISYRKVVPGFHNQ